MKHKHGIVLLLILMGLQFGAVPIFACSGNFRETIPQEHIDDAALIVVGVVTGSSDSNPHKAAYTIQVDSYLKGEGPSALLITGYGSGGGDCLNRIMIDERWIFMLDGDPAVDEVLHASYLQVYDAVWDASSERIAELTALIGRAPTLPYSTPLWTVIQYWTYSPVFKTALMIGAPLVIVAGGLGILRIIKRRQTKKKNSPSPA